MPIHRPRFHALSRAAARVSQATRWTPRVQGIQRGLSSLGLLMMILIGGFFVIVGFKVLPAFVEHRAIKAIVEDLSDSTLSSSSEVRNAFSKRAELDYVQSIAATDLNISRDGMRYAITYDYEKRIPLLGNAFLVLQFSN